MGICISDSEDWKPGFAVHRYGDLSQPVEVSLEFVGTAEPGIDFDVNLPRTEKGYKLTVSPGYPVLNILVDPFEGSFSESKSVHLWMRPDEVYTQTRAHSTAGLEIVDSE